MENKGKFYGIGVGVGDPENITLKAIKALNKVDVIVLPEAKEGEGSTAFSIVKEYVKEDVKQLFLEFPMIKDVEARKIFRKNNAEIIKKELEQGKNVAFLTIGDPMTYSTYTYVLEHIDNGTEVETISGISSFVDMASRFNFPLMIGDETLKVVSLNKKTDIDFELQHNNNIVFMKVSRNFEKLREALIKSGDINNLIMVSNCGKDTQKVYFDIMNLTEDDIPYFTTMIVKKGGFEKWKKF